MAHETNIGISGDNGLNSAQMGSAPRHIADRGLETVVDYMFAKTDRDAHEMLHHLSAVAIPTEAISHTPATTSIGYGGKVSIDNTLELPDKSSS